MKKPILVLYFFLATFYIKAQFGPEQVIDSSLISTNYYLTAFSIDMDGDGDNDVVSSHSWHENLGNGIFTKHIIDSIYFPYIFAAADMDNDGDIDVVSGPGDFYWYENLGSEVFGTRTYISSKCYHKANDQKLADIDNDGDMDIIFTSLEYGTSISPWVSCLSWIPNLGNGNFGTRTAINPIGNDIYDGSYGVNIADLDGDGDNDVITGHMWGNNGLEWFEHLNNGSFGLRNNLTTSIEYSFLPIDIDNDSDIDILTIDNNSSSFKMFENFGNGNFGTNPSTNGICNTDAFFLDIDANSDGDRDVLNYSPQYGMSWVKNTGNGILDTVLNTISLNQTQGTAGVFQGTAGVFVVDLDSDGDEDIIEASGSKLVWFENLSTVSITENKNESKLVLIPNPTSSRITIDSDLYIKEVEIFDLAGKSIKSIKRSIKTINVFDLHPGIYYIKIKGEEKTITKKFIKL
jgi:type IX secretion system substrate protein/VCBS repeat protein